MEYEKPNHLSGWVEVKELDRTKKDCKKREGEGSSQAE